MGSPVDYVSEYVCGIFVTFVVKFLNMTLHVCGIVVLNQHFLVAWIHMGQFLTLLKEFDRYDDFHE